MNSCYHDEVYRTARSGSVRTTRTSWRYLDLTVTKQAVPQVTAEPFKVLGFHLSVSLNITRFLWLKYVSSQNAQPDHPQYVSFRIGSVSY